MKSLKFLFLILFISCSQPTEPEAPINVSGAWTSERIELNIKQNGTDLTGTAMKDSIVYLIYGSIRSPEKVFMYLKINDITELTFAGAIVSRTIKGTIKSECFYFYDYDITEITFVRVANEKP